MHWAGYQAFSAPLLLKFFIINSNFVCCKIVRKKSFYDCFLFQTKLGDYQAGYTDDQCFCYDEVKSWFFLQFLNQVFFESSELAKAWWLRLNDRAPQYGRLCARMPQEGRGRSFKVTEKDATVRRYVVHEGPPTMRSNAIQEWFGCWALPWWLLQTLWKASYWAPVNTFLLNSSP